MRGSAYEYICVTYLETSQFVQTSSVKDYYQFIEYLHMIIMYSALLNSPDYVMGVGLC